MAAEPTGHDPALIDTLMAALRPFTHRPSTPALLEAWAVACACATPGAMHVLEAGHGWVQLTFKQAWPDTWEATPTERATPRRYARRWEITD
jgi:hypothetical protein